MFAVFIHKGGKSCSKIIYHILTGRPLDLKRMKGLNSLLLKLGCRNARILLLSGDFLIVTVYHMKWLVWEI
jgi:hypothetical protein